MRLLKTHFTRRYCVRICLQSSSKDIKRINLRQMQPPMRHTTRLWPPWVTSMALQDPSVLSTVIILPTCNYNLLVKQLPHHQEEGMWRCLAEAMERVEKTPLSM